MLNYKAVHVGSASIRIFLLFFGLWQDSNLHVKFTDVDYHVFTDGAKYVYEGKSPYERPTYRYSPVFSWLLLPCHFINILWGKLLFIIADLITGFLIQNIMQIQCQSPNIIKLSICLWLFNPLTMTVSSRGNAESVMSLLVVGFLYSLHKKWTFFAGFLFSISVHLKIYPLIYMLPIYLFLGAGYDGSKAEITFSYLWSCLTTVSFSPLLKTLFSKPRLKFFSTALATFSFLTSVFYYHYGFDFLEHSYFYHLTRTDIRHNFSVYFYMLYTNNQWYLGILCFFSQLLTTISISLRFYRDLPFCCFLLTYVFVTFNKVCTSQYFLWYMSLLPLIIGGLRNVTKKEICIALIAWFLSQSVWLISAYYLEFKGASAYLYVWAASLLFFACNVMIIVWLMSKYDPAPTFLRSGQLNTYNQSSKKYE